LRSEEKVLKNILFEEIELLGNENRIKERSEKELLFFDIYHLCFV